MSPIKPPQEPTFAKPILLLGDCHRRIEKFLDQLVHVTETAGNAPLSDQSRHDLSTALRYFNQLPLLHNADEEESLFPRLRDVAQGETETAAKAREALKIMERLEAEHDVSDKSHADVEAIGNRWLENGLLPGSDLRLLQDKLLSLQKFYAAHLALEDDLLFPLAATLLDRKELESIGREMATRRGVDYDSPDAIHRCAKRKHRID